MLISALNALTFSPALCSVLLKQGQKRRGPMRYVLGAIERARNGYAAVVSRLVRVAVGSVVVVIGVLAGAVGLLNITPPSFLPQEDHGAFFATMNLLDSASINRTQTKIGRAHVGTPFNNANIVCTLL